MVHHTTIVPLDICHKPMQTWQLGQLLLLCYHYYYFSHSTLLADCAPCAPLLRLDIQFVHAFINYSVAHKTRRLLWNSHNEICIAEYRLRMPLWNSHGTMQACLALFSASKWTKNGISSSLRSMRKRSQNIEWAEAAIESSVWITLCNNSQFLLPFFEWRAAWRTVVKWNEWRPEEWVDSVVCRKKGDAIYKKST